MFQPEQHHRCSKREPAAARRVGTGKILMIQPAQVPPDNDGTARAATAGSIFLIQAD